MLVLWLDNLRVRLERACFKNRFLSLDSRNYDLQLGDYLLGSFFRHLSTHFVSPLQFTDAVVDLGDELV